MNSKSVRVDEDKWEAVRALGYNHSELHDIIMDIVLSADFDSTSYDVQFNIIKSKIEEQKQTVSNTKHRLAAEESELAYLEHSLAELQSTYEKDRQVLALSRAMGRLNQIIVVANYDVTVVRATAADLIAEIYELNPAFDLEKQCEVLKDSI